MATFQAIQDEIAGMLDIPDEELTDEQRAVMDDYLDELASQEAAKIDGFAQLVKLESARADALKEESKRLSARAKAAENRLAWLKGKYLDTMRGHGLKKLSGDVYTLSVRESQSVAITARVEELPSEYVREKVTREADKVAIRDALKNGAVIPGATLGVGYSLQIR